MRLAQKTYIHALLCVGFLTAALPAQARNGGLYFELAPAWGFFLTDEVIIEDGDDDGSDFPTGGFVPQLKLGFHLFGLVGAELDVAAHGWDLGVVDRGGAGYIGGAVRVTPLELLQWVIPEDVRFPDLLHGEQVSWHDRFFDIGVYLGGGYTLIGEDYAYQGAYLKWGFDAKWYITPFFALGMDLPFRIPMYEPFRYTNYSTSKGLCVDGKDAYGRGGIPVPVMQARATSLEFDATDISSACDGRPPEAIFFTPALTISGVIDFGI